MNAQRTDSPSWLALEPEPPPSPPRWSRLTDGLRLLFWTFLRTDRVWRLTARVETDHRPYAWSARFIAAACPVLVLGWAAALVALFAVGVEPHRIVTIASRLAVYLIAAALIMPAMVLAPLLRWPVGVVAALAPTVLLIAPFGSLVPPAFEHGPQAVLPVMMTATWGIRLGPAGALGVGALMAVGGGALLGWADGVEFGLGVALVVVAVALRVGQWLVEWVAGGRWPQVFDADGVLPMPRARARVLAELATGRPGAVSIALARNPLRRWQLRGAIRAWHARHGRPPLGVDPWLADPRLDAPEHLRPGSDRASRPTLRHHVLKAARR